MKHNLILRVIVKYLFPVIALFALVMYYRLGAAPDEPDAAPRTTAGARLRIRPRPGLPCRVIPLGLAGRHERRAQGASGDLERGEVTPRDLEALLGVDRLLPGRLGVGEDRKGTLDLPVEGDRVDHRHPRQTRAPPWRRETRRHR